MDMSNWRHTEGGSGDVGDSSMESSDWRAQIQADLRKRMVNRILDAMKSHLQVYGIEGLQELEKIAVNFEEKVYVAATSQSDYTRKICFKILTIETTISQNPIPDAYSVNKIYPALLDSTNGEDWREEVYEKITNMKNLYLQDLNAMHQNLVRKLQQQLNDEQIEKLKVFKNMLERFMAFLQIPKQNMLEAYKDKLTTYEKQIVYIITYNLRKPGPTQQQHMGDGQSSQQQQLQSMIPVQVQQQRPMQVASSTSFDSTAQTVNPNGGDWQEEVYQKIKAMKDLYLVDLNDMHQKILNKLQQHDSLPHEINNEQIEKLKIFKNLVERFMAFLQIPKHTILANYKDKLSTYEKQIVHIITSNRRKPGPTQQPPHMRSQETDS